MRPAARNVLAALLALTSMIGALLMSLSRSSR